MSASTNTSLLQRILTLLLSLLLFLLASPVGSQTPHPGLILTRAGVERVRSQLGTVPLFDQVLAQARTEVDLEMEQAIAAPVPRDMAGGYTHERHKRNWSMMQSAGVLFQLTGEEKYAVYVRDMLLAYAQLYLTLPLHPTNNSYARGKIFWQCLNDANWLVYVSQAYDCIYDWLSPAEVKLLNTQLFRPFADFLSVDNPQFFNRIHNHSTWANAAVGMIGLVMNDEELIQRALYGLPQDAVPADLRDNDNGLIKLEGQTAAGFLAQLDYSFSPDGYFTEGPYYLRYALSPFLLFAKGLANQRPELGIMGYRDSILRQAVYALLYQADYQGQFFPINDSQKGMSWLAGAVVTAIDFAYYEFGQDPALLDIAHRQGTVVLDEAGFAVAKGLAAGLKKPFIPKSIAFVDGADGDRGGVGILRSPAADGGEICLVMKYSAQGMGHGHFDKLSYSLYDEKGEIVQDYGAARWVNIDQKGGGRYLPENNTWAKQSIAHNTLVVNETSHYAGDITLGEAHQPELYAYDVLKPGVQMVSAKDDHAYPGQALHRTQLLISDAAFPYPLLLDIFRVGAATPAQYDLPTWFQGQLMSTNFDYTTAVFRQRPLGKAHGYQHLWCEAVGQTDQGIAQVGWFGNGKFYTQTSVVGATDSLLFVRLGANDPYFNLRRDPGFLIRRQATAGSLFVSVLETHGSYSPVAEIPLEPYGTIADLAVRYQDDNYTLVTFSQLNGATWTVLLANEDAADEHPHEVRVGTEVYRWQGPFKLIKK